MVGSADVTLQERRLALHLRYWLSGQCCGRVCADVVIHHVKQVVQLEGLAEMPCNLQRRCVMNSISRRGHQNNVGVRRGGLSVRAYEVLPVHHRHVQIQKNHAGRRSRDQLEPMSTVMCEGDQVATSSLSERKSKGPLPAIRGFFSAELLLFWASVSRVGRFCDHTTRARAPNYTEFSSLRQTARRQDTVKQIADRGSVLYHQHAPFVTHRPSPNMHDACIDGATRGCKNG